jgi:hypothetical protein
MEHIAQSFIVLIRRKMKMKSSLVRRDQFNITPQGIVHKPTDAAFTPYAGDPIRACGAYDSWVKNRPVAMTTMIPNTCGE